MKKTIIASLIAICLLSFTPNNTHEEETISTAVTSNCSTYWDDDSNGQAATGIWMFVKIMGYIGAGVPVPPMTETYGDPIPTGDGTFHRTVTVCFG